MEHITEIAGIEIPQDSPFMKQIQQGQTISINGKPMGLHIFNTIQAYHQVGLWLKTNKKIIPYRGWKISDLYWYYGIPMKRDHGVLLHFLGELLETYLPIKAQP